MSLSEEGSAPVSRSARTAQSPRHVRLPESRFFKSQMYCSTFPAIATHRHLPGRLPRWDVCGFSVRAALPRREGRRVVPFSAERWHLLWVRREASQNCSPWMLTALERSSICPNSGISGLAGHVSLAFTSLASSMSPRFSTVGSKLIMSRSRSDCDCALVCSGLPPQHAHPGRCVRGDLAWLHAHRRRQLGLFPRRLCPFARLLEFDPSYSSERF